MKLLTILFLSSFTIAYADKVKLPKKENFQLFLLAGQSNMAGRGKLDGAAKKTIPQVLALNQLMEWQAAVDPLHWDKKAAGVGIGKTFAATIAEDNPEDSIGLIPGAVGGSAISLWIPGGYHQPTKSHPYDDALKRAAVAMEKGTFKAILWHQGESDSNAKDAPLYEKRLKELIRRFRKDLGQPDLPFILGQLGDFPGTPANPHRDTVNKASKAVSEKMDHVAYITSEGFTSDDGLHFDSKSVRSLGERYAAGYLDLIGDQP